MVHVQKGCLAHPNGSDTVFTCNQCDYAANDEVATARPRALSDPDASEDQSDGVRMWHGLSKDRKTLVKVFLVHLSLNRHLSEDKARFSRFQQIQSATRGKRTSHRILAKMKLLAVRSADIHS